MNKARKIDPQKQAIVESLSSTLSEAPLIALVDYNGITVEQINQIRRSLESKGINYVVAKNTLILKAVEGSDKEGLAPYLKGMTGLVISNEDAIGSAKAIREVSKEFKTTFNIKGGFFDGDILNAIGVDKVADLPSKEELLSTLLRTIQEPARQILGVLQGPARDLMFLLKNYEEKLSEAE
jgi:large subunit ribosomal protein L10